MNLTFDLYQSMPFSQNFKNYQCNFNADNNQYHRVQKCFGRQVKKYARDD